MAFRSKWFDPDLRKTPQTSHFCVMCGRDLKPGQQHRRVMYELDRYEAVHSDDWDIAEKEIRASRTCNRDPVVFDAVGMDCAKKLGFEWSRE